MQVVRLYSEKDASGETGQNEFPCRRRLPVPWRFPQHDGLLLELRNKKFCFILSQSTV